MSPIETIPTVVLVVDDEEIDTSMMRRALKLAGGFVVLEEATAEGALRTFREKREEIDLLITDVSLPGMNGIELAKTMLRERPALKVLFTSGWVGAELLRLFRVVEADRHFLAKPFGPAELLERVRSVLADDAPLEWIGGDADAKTPKTGDVA
jgi:DNA-binding NarL/FixJ family response regulator